MIKAIADLAEASTHNDARFSCLVRVVFEKLDGIVNAVNEALPDDQQKLPRAAVADLSHSLIEFQAFRRVPDYREHMIEWLNGKPLGILLSEAEARMQAREAEKKKTEEAKENSDQDGCLDAQEDISRHPPEATIFGGDDNAPTPETAHSPEAPINEVPQM